MTFLFDTNVISELFRRTPNPGVIAFAQQVRLIRISAISLDEILFGLAAKPKPRILKRFEIFVEKQCVVLSVNAETARRSGKLRGQLQRKGISRCQADMMIAAIAQQHRLTLVTRNVKDFELCDIEIINPFS